LARPPHGVVNVLLLDSKLSQPGSDFVGTASLQRAQDDALSIRAHVEVFHLSKTGYYGLGERYLVFDGLLSQHDCLIQGNKDILPCGSTQSKKD
jgi:hypothetical protein